MRLWEELREGRTAREFAQVSAGSVARSFGKGCGEDWIGLASHFDLCSNEFLGKTGPERLSLAKPCAPPRGLLTCQALPAIQTFKYQRLPPMPNTGHMPQ